MTLFKRHIGRRVAGVGVGVALLMLGLEAPAFAAAPTVTAFSPTSGPAACIMAITGTAFTDSTKADTDVFFRLSGVDLAAADFEIVSATEIWAEVPNTLAAGASYTIRVVNNGGTADGPGSFLFTTGVGGCAPTITTFAPTCGLAGATVKITGTNLLSGVDPAATETEVRFFDYVAATTEADHTVPNVDTPTELSVLVPAGAKDGPIRVTTSLATGGQVFSTDSFQVPPPDCTPAVVEHARSVSLSLRKHLVARGKVSVGDGFTDCAASVPVKIQRRVSGRWKTVGSTTTSDTGAYKKRIKDTPGKYRAKATQVTLNAGADVCLGARSPVRRNT